MANYNLGTAEGLIRVGYDGTGATQAERGFENVEKSATRSSATLDRAGTRAGIAGGLIAAGIAFATSKAIDFEKQISAIGAVTGASGADMDALRQKALRLGADTSFSASQAAQAMEELAKAGISLPDILNGAADATVALAAAGGIALPEAATIAANAMNGFGLTAKELPGIVDLIAGAANASAIDVGQFGQSMQQSAAVAHLAGVPFSDLAVAIAELGNAGIKGSDAGTSLKTFLQNLIPVTKEQIALSKQLGLTTADGANAFFDASGKVKSLADVAQVLQNSLKGMSQEQKIAALQTLFGSDAIRAAAIISDQGAAGFNNLAAAMGKTSAADVAAARLNNTAGQIEQLKGSTETAAIAFGSVLLPRLNSLAQALTSLGNWLSGLSPKWQSVVIDTTAAAAGFLLLTAAIVKIITTVQIINSAVAAIKLWTIWSNIASVATKAWAIANGILSISILGTPLGWILLAIVAVIAVVILLIKYHKEIGAWIASVWGKFLDFVKPVTDWFAGPFANFFVAAWNIVKAAFASAVQFINGLWNGVIAAAQAVGSFFAGVFNFFAPLVQAIFGLVVAIIQTAMSIIGAIFAVAQALFDATIGAAFRAIYSNAVTTFNNVVGVITAAFNFLLPFILFIWNSILAFLTVVLNGILAVVRFSVNGVTSAVSTGWSLVSAVTSGIWNSIWSLLVGIWNGILGTARGVWNGLVAVISAVWNTIVAVVRSGVAQVTAVINTISGIVRAVGGFFNQLRGAAEGGVGSLIAFVSGIPGRILGALGNLAGILFGAGQDVVQGMINGIRSMVGSLASQAADMARSALNAAKGALGISSPSKVFMQVGQFTIEGFIRGVLRTSDSAVRAVERVITETQQVALGIAPGFDLTLGAGAGLLPQLVGAGGGVTINVTGTQVNVPAVITDPNQIASLTARRIGTTVATAASGALGGS